MYAQARGHERGSLIPGVVRTEKVRSRPPNRQIYWMEEANRHLANWLYVREILVKRCPDRKCNPKALFVSTSSWSIGRRPHRHTVGAAITQYAREAGITENISMTMNWIPPACDVIDVDNVGMAKSRCCLGLLYEPPLSFGIGDFLGRENFDGDEPVQVRVAGLVCTPDPSHRGRAFRGSDSAGRCVRPWHNAELWYASQIDSRQRVRWIERPAGWTLLMPDTYVDVRLWCVSEVSRSEWADWYGTALLSKIRISPGKRRPQNQTALLGNRATHHGHLVPN